MTGKVYKQPFISRQLLFAPLIGAVGGLIVREAAAGLVLTIAVLLLLTARHVTRRPYRLSFDADGSLIWAVFGTRARTIKSGDLESCAYKRLAQEWRWFETSAFELYIKSGQLFYGRKLIIGTKGWGDQQQALFTDLSAWLVKTGVSLDDVAKQKLSDMMAGR